MHFHPHLLLFLGFEEKGDSGNDVIGGGLGADVFIGFPGDDQIYQFRQDSNNIPDGSIDEIDCGPGIDEAWISTVDGDTAVNCETVHTT